MQGEPLRWLVSRTPRLVFAGQKFRFPLFDEQVTITP
jgi:hypothetical protein